MPVALPPGPAHPLALVLGGGGPGANERGQLVKAASRKVEEFRVDFSDEVIAFEEQIKEDFGHLADTAMSFSHAVVRAPLDEFFGGEWLYLSPGHAENLIKFATNLDRDLPGLSEFDAADQVGRLEQGTRAANNTNWGRLCGFMWLLGGYVSSLQAAVAAENVMGTDMLGSLIDIGKATRVWENRLPLPDLLPLLQEAAAASGMPALAVIVHQITVSGRGLWEWVKTRYTHQLSLQDIALVLGLLAWHAIKIANQASSWLEDLSTCKPPDITNQSKAFDTSILGFISHGSVSSWPPLEQMLHHLMQRLPTTVARVAGDGLVPTVRADVLAVARLALGSVRIALQKIDLKASTDLPFSDVEAIAKGEGWYMLQENQVELALPRLARLLLDTSRA